MLKKSIVLGLGMVLVFALFLPALGNVKSWAKPVKIGGEEKVFVCFIDTTLDLALTELSKVGIPIKFEGKPVKLKNVTMMAKSPEVALGMTLVGTDYWYVKENGYYVVKKLNKIKEMLKAEELTELEAEIAELKEKAQKEKEYWAEQPKVTETFTNADLREALNTIAYDAGVNIFLDQTVEGVTTCEFKKTPLELVLWKILLPYGYTFKKINGDYLVGTAFPDSLSFEALSETTIVKLDYLTAGEAISSLSSFFKPYITANEERNTITITGSPEIVARIKGDLEKIDTPLLKKVEIRLISLEYSNLKKAEISLDALNLFLGKLPRTGISGIQIGNQTLGASLEDDLRSYLTLRVLSDLKEVTITGDQKTTVLEGQSAKIARDKEGVIFIAPEQGAYYLQAYYYPQKETVQAGQGVEVKVIRVTKNNEILLNVQGRLEDIGKITEQGQAIWIDRRNVNTTVPLENYQTISIGTLTRKVSEKQKGITSKYTSEEEIETIFLLTANVIGTEKPAVIEMDEEVGKFFKEIEERKLVERKVKFGLGLGIWSSESIKSPLVICDAELSINSLRIFGGGGSRHNSSWVGYFGLKYGDFVSLGLGGINSELLRKTEMFYCAGISIGTKSMKLEGDYFYVPENEKTSGVRAVLRIKF